MHVPTWFVVRYNTLRHVPGLLIFTPLLPPPPALLAFYIVYSTVPPIPPFMCSNQFVDFGHGHLVIIFIQVDTSISTFTLVVFLFSVHVFD